MPDLHWGLWLFIAVLVGLAGYALFVNRRVQHYRSSTTFDAPVDEVFRMHLTVDWIRSNPQVQSVEALRDGLDGLDVTYTSGARYHSRNSKVEENAQIESTGTYIWPGQSEPGDALISRTTFRAEGEGTKVDSVIIVERAGLRNGFLPRLIYPFVARLGAQAMRRELQRRRDSGVLAPGVAQIAQPPGKTGVNWIALFLAAATLAWLIMEFGPYAGLAVLLFLVLHEYGHVWSMRRNGHAASRLYLVPFFGGLAIGNQTLQSDAEDAEISLMGPVFGFAPCLGALLLYWLTDSTWMAGVAFLMTAINLFNLLPIPPLDGGRVLEVLVRPFGRNAMLIASGVFIAAGALLGFYLKSQMLVVMAVLSGVGMNARIAAISTRRPLDRAGYAQYLGLYLGLAALHVLMIVILIRQETWRGLLAGLAGGPDFF